jgi:hypothetical protein
MLDPDSELDLHHFTIATIKILRDLLHCAKQDSASSSSSSSLSVYHTEATTTRKNGCSTSNKTLKKQRQRELKAQVRTAEFQLIQVLCLDRLCLHILRTDLNYGLSGFHGSRQNSATRQTTGSRPCISQVMNKV